ncbi:hypothetical protein M2G37_12595 [Vibrio vulnificus]|nr:hypothetical protein [Vibrio vulnificus]
MANSELSKLIQLYFTKKDDTPIHLADVSERRHAFNFLLNSHSGTIRLFALTDESGNSSILDILNDKKTTKNLLKYLSNAENRIIVLTNDTANIRKSSWYQQFSDANRTLDITALPKKLYAKFQSKFVDNELILFEPSTYLFFGKYDMEQRTKAESVTTFLNFSDEDLYKTFKKFFEEAFNSSKTGSVD